MNDTLLVEIRQTMEYIMGSTHGVHCLKGFQCQGGDENIRDENVVCSIGAFYLKVVQELENISGTRTVVADGPMGGKELEDRELVARALRVCHGELHGNPATGSKGKLYQRDVSLGTTAAA
jgi:hypothetical protein